MPEDPIVEQLMLGFVATRDITLATTLMCKDYPGVELDEVVPDEDWPRNGKPLCTFKLRVPQAAEGQIREWFATHEREGLPVSSTKEYDRCKKQLVDAMRNARARVMQGGSR